MLFLTRLALAGAAAAATACAGGADYARLTAEMRGEGLLRTERAPADAPWSNADLARDFALVALNREFRRSGDGLVAEATPTPLSRWEGPIRYEIAGASATAEDRRAFSEYAARLARLTGLDIAEAGTEGEVNMSVLFLGPWERLDLLRQIHGRGMAKDMALPLRWAEDDDFPCVGQIGMESEAGGRIRYAAIFIRGELGPLMRRACIEEETAQSLGLFNDDDRVRPSVFNDDQEFALLTEHDEWLLRVLYDPRLRPGMPPDDAAAAARAVIEDLRPEG